jgi:hypothetical protein
MKKVLMATILIGIALAAAPVRSLPIMGQKGLVRLRQDGYCDGNRVRVPMAEPTCLRHVRCDR